MGGHPDYGMDTTYPLDAMYMQQQSYQHGGYQQQPPQQYGQQQQQPPYGNEVTGFGYSPMGGPQGGEMHGQWFDSDL